MGIEDFEKVEVVIEVEGERESVVVACVPDDYDDEQLANDPLDDSIYFYLKPSEWAGFLASKRGDIVLDEVAFIGFDGDDNV